MNIKELIEKYQYTKVGSGFIDLDDQQSCNNEEHFPPKFLYIPHGKAYRHVCPKCGHVTIVSPPQITY